MAKIAWERPEKCPVVNGYVIRVMTTSPDRGARPVETKESRAGSEPQGGNASKGGKEELQEGQ